MSESSLVEHDGILRVAIGVFDDLTKLYRVLEEFRTVGLAARQVTLLANAGVLSDQLEAGFVPCRSARTLETPKLVIRGKTPQVGVADVEACASQAAPLTRDQVMHFERWIPAKLSKELNVHLAKGECILIAPIAKVEQERKISEILLDHSTSSVQLHDIALQR